MKETLNFQKELLALKQKLQTADFSEQNVLGIFDFSIVLTAIHSILSGTKPVGLKPSEDPDIDKLKQHLKTMTGIENKESALQYLAHMRNFGCARKYQDFLGFWSGNPTFEVESLNERQRENFETLKEFSEQFQEVVQDKSLAAWDVGESIQIVREAYVCGYLEEELCYEIINDFAHIAIHAYDNWIDYAMGYICGGCLFMYECTKNEKYTIEMCQKLIGAVDKLFFEEGLSIWRKYAWYKEKQYFPNLKEKEELVKEQLGCYVTDRISIDGCEVKYMERQPQNPKYADSGWKFLAGDETGEYLSHGINIGVFDLNTIANYDKSIIPFLDSPVGTVYAKNEDGMWVLRKSAQRRE